MRYLLFILSFILLAAVACAAPKVRAPKILPKVHSRAALAPSATADGYVPSWTNIEVRPDGSATLRIDFAGKRPWHLDLLLDKACSTVTDLATGKVVMTSVPKYLCDLTRAMRAPMEKFVEACVASGGCVP